MLVHSKLGLATDPDSRSSKSNIHFPFSLNPKSPLSPPSPSTMSHCPGLTHSARQRCSSLTEGLTKCFATEAPQLKTLMATQ